MKSLFIFFGISLLFFQVLASTIQDAELALQELDDLTLQKQGELHLLMNTEATKLRTQLDNLVESTQEEVRNQTTTILARITTLAENARSAGGETDQVDTCLDFAVSDFEQFVDDLSERLENCRGHMIMAGNELLESTWARVWDEYDIRYQCNRMSLDQCRNYEKEECVDMVLDNIQMGKDRIVPDFDGLTAMMESQVPGMNFPCRGMILQEVALYSRLSVDFIKSCLDSIVDNAVLSTFTC